MPENEELSVSSNMNFYEQIGGVAGVFESWTACERTVVLCALLRRVPWGNLKMLKRHIEASLAQQASPETQKLEADANDPVYMAQLVKFNDEDDVNDLGDRMRKLLTLLPVVRPGNEPCKEAVLGCVPALVQRCVDSAAHTDDCQQLLSYLLIHPGLTPHDRRSLSQWLHYLESHISSVANRDIWAERTLVTQTKGSNPVFRRTIGKNVDFKGTPDSAEPFNESFSKNGRDLSLEDREFDFQLKPRSNSLTPPYSNISSSAENLSDHFFQKPRSFSLSSEHSLALLKPMSAALATTGSETRLDDLKAHKSEHPGMSTVAHWLKSLRLHKYVWLFSNISYEQMLAIDEDYLQKLGVTKGARHKLLLCIGKLGERGALLAQLERELRAAGAGGGAVSAALHQLRAVLASPIPPGSPLAPAIVRILELASTCLLAGGAQGGAGALVAVAAPAPAPWLAGPQCEEGPPDGAADAELTVEPVSLHCWLVDKALHHEAVRCSSELVDALQRLRYRLPPSQFFSRLSDLPYSAGAVKPRHNKNKWRSVNSQKPKRSWGRVGGGGGGGGRDFPYKSSSYPVFPPYPSPAHCLALGASASMGDINTRLESLCLQMTERAIN